MNKVGATTGWTYARIASTCIGANVKDTNITLLCQSRSETQPGPGAAGPGDSGSAVFYWNGRL